MLLYPRNALYPPAVYAKPRNAADNLGIGSGVTGYHIVTDPVTGATTRTATANGNPSHVAGGLWKYVPTQGETDYEEFAIEFYKNTASGYGEIVPIITADEPLTKAAKQLYGVRDWPIYKKTILFATEPDDNGLATWPYIVYDQDEEPAPWRCYYTARDGNGKYCIRVRTSSDGLTGWSTGTTCVSAGGSGEWNEDGVWCGIPTRVGSGDWRMIATGRNAAQTVVSVGYYSSSSGLAGWLGPNGHWLNIEGNNPVMSPSLGWEHDSCECTGLIYDDDINKYVMYYTNLATTAQRLTFPAFARKVGRATSTNMEDWTKDGDPIFGASDTGYERQPYHGYYSGNAFRNGSTGLFNIAVAEYGPNSDYSQFRLYECPTSDFPRDKRRPVSTIMSTQDFEYPNQEVDILSFAGDDIRNQEFTQAGEIRAYFGCKHDGTWSIAVMKQPSMLEALRWVPNIAERLTPFLDSQRWDKATEEILTTARTESYASQGSEASVVELLYMLQQFLTQFAITNGRRTVYQLDGTSIAGKFDYNHVSNPTSLERVE